jgi:hypothetical protein
VAAIAATRQRGRRVRFTMYLVVAVLVLWSMHAIVVKDTDWSRIHRIAPRFDGASSSSST